MKLIAKVALFTVLGGVGAATMYAAPGGAAGGNDDALIRGITIQNRMKGDLAQIFQLKAKAKRDHDVIKLNCVNDKLVEANPLMNITDHLIVEIEGGRDHLKSESLLGTITENGAHMQRLREAAAQCVDSKVLANESSNSFTHPDVPPLSSTNPNGGIEPPIYASPDK